MNEQPTSTKGLASWGVSTWLLAIAAAGGLGVGTGVAVGRSRSVEPARAPSGLDATVVTKEPERTAKAEPVAAKPAPVEPSAAAVVPDEPAAVVPPVVPVDPNAPPLDPVAVDKALDEVFKKKKADRQMAKEFYAAHGAGRFARGAVSPSAAVAGADVSPSAAVAGAVVSPSAAAAGAAPTALGAAVVARIKALPQHAIDVTPYDVEALEAAVSEAATAGDGGAALDARLFRGFLDLVMDSRFLHKAGPFRVWDKADIYEREKKELKDFMAAMLAAPDAASAMAMLDPPHPLYAPMLAVLADYRAKALVANCPTLSAGWRFRAGSKGAEVKKLQERLACEGYYAGELDGLFEGATVEAVKAYQEHHDLPPEGNVLEETMKSLNVSMARRVKQIELTLQRMRESRYDRMGDYFIRVNIPSFTLKVFEKGQVIREQRVIVGTNKLDDDKVQLLQGHINRTKVFGTRLYQVIVNPTWILPKRVEEGELATSLDKDQDYLAKSNIKKVKLGSGTEVFVQGAGKGNVLGKVKFLLEESNAIYLHDTDKRHLFKKQRRDFSHGCMRVDQAVDFGKWLLQRDGWPAAEIDKAFGSAMQRGFDMKTPVNLVTEYMTVDLLADGKPVFYDDIYDYDDAFWNDKLPLVERVRWGSKVMRPRWVPLMDEATVDGWRKANKPAPRNLGPDGKPKPDAKAPKSDIDEGP